MIYDMFVFYQFEIFSNFQNGLREVSFFIGRGAPENWGEESGTYPQIKRGDQKIFQIKRGGSLIFFKETK